MTRCAGCGLEYDSARHSDFCPHDAAVVQVIGPSIMAKPPAQSALENAKLELSNRLLAAGLPSSSFRTWIDLAAPQGPRGDTDETLLPRPALHIAIVADHPAAAPVDATIMRLPNNLQGLDVHYHQGE